MLLNKKTLGSYGAIWKKKKEKEKENELIISVDILSKLTHQIMIYSILTVKMSDLWPQCYV